MAKLLATVHNYKRLTKLSFKERIAATLVLIAIIPLFVTLYYATQLYLYEKHHPYAPSPDYPIVSWLERSLDGALHIPRAPKSTNGSQTQTSPLAAQHSVLVHAGGAYGVDTPNDVAQATSLGLTLDITRWVPTAQKNLGPTAQTNHMFVIDRDVWALISQNLPDCRRSLAPCPLSASLQQNIMTTIKQHLDGIRSDNTVVGVYVLDDYPGNINGLLDQVQALVNQENANSSNKWQTVCGFAVGGFDTAATNYSPLHCDIPLLYGGSVTTTGDINALAPLAISGLQQRGWNHSKQPLFASVPTFDAGSKNKPTPSPDAVRSATARYCQLGADSIIAFTWDAGTDPATSLQGLKTHPELQTAFQQGISDCQKLWSSR